MAKRTKTRKAGKARKASGRKRTAKASRRKRTAVAAAPRKTRKPRRVYRIGAAPRKQPRTMKKGSSLMTIAKGGAMTGAGQVLGLYAGGMAARFITNPYLRGGAVFAAGVLLGKMAPGLRNVGEGMAGTGVVLLAAPLLPGLPAPAGGAGVTGVGALTARERKMIEQAAMGVGAAGSPQSEVLTGLYDTENVLA